METLNNNAMAAADEAVMTVNPQLAARMGKFGTIFTAGGHLQQVGTDIPGHDRGDKREKELNLLGLQMVASSVLLIVNR